MRIICAKYESKDHDFVSNSKLILQNFEFPQFCPVLSVCSGACVFAGAKIFTSASSLTSYLNHEFCKAPKLQLCDMSLML